MNAIATSTNGWHTITTGDRTIRETVVDGFWIKETTDHAAGVYWTESLDLESPAAGVCVSHACPIS